MQIWIARIGIVSNWLQHQLRGKPDTAKREVLLVLKSVLRCSEVQGAFHDIQAGGIFAGTASRLNRALTLVEN